MVHYQYVYNYTIGLLCNLFILQPFDPHYTPVDIEKPSFSPTPRLSLLSVDMFQTLYKARTNHIANRNGNLYIDQPSIHPNSHYDQSDSSDLRGTGENGSELSEVSILHTVTSLDDDTLSKICTLSESSYQPLNDSEQYIQHVPLPRKLNSLKDDYQDNLLGSSDLDYTDSALVGTREGDASHNRLHFWEQNSLPLPLSDPFPSLCADLAEANPIQLDKPYISSESGYIQSHDANCSAAQSLCIEEDTNLDLDTTNQRQTITQLAQMPLIERLESPTTLLDNESMKSMDSGLNCYDFGEHTQMNNSEDEVDMYESDPTNDEEHHGYIKHEQHDNIISKTGLMPYPLDIDLDFIPVPSGPVRPTTIDIRHTSDDTTTSDLSSGYITSCMSHDDNALMELLFQQKLKDVKET